MHGYTICFWQVVGIVPFEANFVHKLFGTHQTPVCTNKFDIFKGAR